LSYDSALTVNNPLPMVSLVYASQLGRVTRHTYISSTYSMTMFDMI